MTDNIRVIYTPNVEKFFRIHYGMAETPDIPLFAANKMGLRENIDGLKSAHTWLPANVGVVTYHYLIKAFQDGSRQRRAESEYYPGVSYFANLDAMEAIKRILDTEPKTRAPKPIKGTIIIEMLLKSTIQKALKVATGASPKKAIFLII